jgi:lipopolysaccharide O-acetyltransferase
MRIFYILFCKLLTIIKFPTARLVRFPIWIRGKKFINFGKNFTSGRGCRIEVYNFNSDSPSLSFGKNVQLNDYVHIGVANEIAIGDNVLIASRVSILDHNHGIYRGSEMHSRPTSKPKDREITGSSILIEDNVWLGENVVVLPGVKIGCGAIIGASSVVTDDIPSNCIAIGVPARIVKRFNEQLGVWEKC